MINFDISKYETSVIKNVNKDNMKNIINFLYINGCDFIEDLLENYLDLFVIEYEDFVNKFNILNDKYNHRLLNEIREDMNILEEFYLV